jgi:hypothetical protein
MNTIPIRIPKSESASYGTKLEKTADEARRLPDSYWNSSGQKST